MKIKNIKNNVGVNFVSIQNGITLITLVITIIIMLILAGIVINSIVSKNGIIYLAKQAEKNYIDAQITEEITLAQYENEIRQYTNTTRSNSRDDTVEISRDLLDSLIPHSIQEDSRLLLSRNVNKATGSYNLSMFENEKSETFDKYFYYDENAGELNCQMSGWYYMKLFVNVDDSTSTSSITYLNCYINDILMCRASRFCSWRWRTA